MKKLLKGRSRSLFCLLAGWTAYIANNGNGVNQDVELSDVEALANTESIVGTVDGKGYHVMIEARATFYNPDGSYQVVTLTCFNDMNWEDCRHTVHHKSVQIEIPGKAKSSVRYQSYNKNGSPI